MTVLVTKETTPRELSQSDVYMKRKRRETAEVHQNGVLWYGFNYFCFAFFGVSFYCLHDEGAVLSSSRPHAYFLGVSSSSLWRVHITRRLLSLFITSYSCPYSCSTAERFFPIQEMTILYIRSKCPCPSERACVCLCLLPEERDNCS